MNAATESLVEKLTALPPEQIAEVEVFVDFLRHRTERSVAADLAQASTPAFSRVWDNPDDDAYDDL